MPDGRRVYAFIDDEVRQLDEVAQKEDAGQDDQRQKKGDDAFF